MLYTTYAIRRYKRLGAVRRNCSRRLNLPALPSSLVASQQYRSLWLIVLARPARVESTVHVAMQCGTVDVTTMERLRHLAVASLNLSGSAAALQVLLVGLTLRVMPHSTVCLRLLLVA